jgi:hypothetical protein
MTYDSINPNHYRGNRRFEPIDVIEDWQLNYRLGNALKYISRNGRKPGEDPAEGIKKAIWYLERELETLRGPLPYDLTYEDVLEERAACALDDEELLNDLDEVFGWDRSLGPVEFTLPATDGPACALDLDTLHKDLTKFEEDEIVATFERRGLILGVDKTGKTYVLGAND